MRGLTDEERSILVDAIECGTCDCVPGHIDEYSESDCAIVDRLKSRCLIVEQDCLVDDDMAHMVVTPAGRLAIVADNAVRGLFAV